MMTERVGPGSGIGARPPSGHGPPGSRGPSSSGGGGGGSPGRPSMPSRPSNGSSAPVSRPVSSTSSSRPPTSSASSTHNRPPGYHGGLEENDKSLKMKIKRTKSGRQEIVSVSRHIYTIQQSVSQL